MTRYCLWEKAWIPVIDRAGQPGMRSLRDALAEAHVLREVFDPSPLVTVAIHRLLQAVLYRVYRLVRDADWVALWRSARFDAQPLDEYAAATREQFDLQHPARPFYQVPFIKDEKTHPITALVLEAASGNNPTLFDHGTIDGAVGGMSLDRAACHLLAHQLFAVGGGVSKPFNRMDGPLTKGLVVAARGRNLFETLLLNLMPLQHWAQLVPDQGEDQPSWELPHPPEPVKEGTEPRGPMHYLTWQSRQLHLCTDPQTGLVTGCQIRQRYCLPKNGRRFDPGKAYRQSDEEGWLPFKVDKQRAAWQFTHVLLQAAEADLARPHLTAWLAAAQGLGQRYGLDVPAVIGLTVSGLTTDPKKAAKIDLWRREQLPIPARLLEHEELVGDLRELLEQARRVEAVLQRSGLALAWSLGERNKLTQAISYIWTAKADGKIPPASTDLARSLGLATRYWPALEGPFRTLLAELSPDDFDPVRERWQQAIRRAAVLAFGAVRDSLLHAEAPYEVLTRIEQAFRGRLTASLAKREGEDDARTDG